MSSVYKIPKITGIPNITTATIDPTGILPCTGTVCKVVVDKLYEKYIPSPNSGGIYQGIAYVMSADYKLGRYGFVAANPSNSSSGGLNANEVWLVEMSSSFWTAEDNQTGSEFNAQFEYTALSQIQSGSKIIFGVITGSSPNLMDNTITPNTFNNPCVSATLIDHLAVNMPTVHDMHVCWVMENANLQQLASGNGSGIVDNGLCLSYTSPNTTIDMASGSLLVGGATISHAGGSFAIPNNKGLYWAVASNDGVSINVIAEDSLTVPVSPTALINTLDGSILPSANGWTQAGGTWSLVDDNINLATMASTGYASLSGGAGTPTLGTTIDFMVHSLPVSNDQPLSVIVEYGVGSFSETVEIGSNYIKLKSNSMVYSIDNTLTSIPTVPFMLRLTVRQNGITAISKVYLNGSPAPILQNNTLSNTTGGTSILVSNSIGFGFASSGTNTATISLVKIYSNTDIAPNFADTSGAVVGSFVVSSATSTPRVGIAGCLFDELLGIRLSGGYITQSQFNSQINALYQLLDNSPQWHMPQGVYHGLVDNNDVLNYLQPGSGLSVNLIATQQDPFKAIIHCHNNSYGIVYQSNMSWTGLTANSANYLYIEYDDIAGNSSLGFTTIEPLSGHIFPLSPVIGQNFYRETDKQNYEWNGSQWIAKCRLFTGMAISNATAITSISPINFINNQNNENLIQTATISSPTAYINFINFINPDFSIYKLKIKKLKVDTNNTYLNMQFSLDNGLSWISGATDYNFFGTTAGGNLGLSNATGIWILFMNGVVNGISNNPSAYASGEITLYSLNTANDRKMADGHMAWIDYDLPGGAETSHLDLSGTCRNASTTAGTVNGIRIFPSNPSTGALQGLITYAEIELWGIR